MEKLCGGGWSWAVGMGFVFAVCGCQGPGGSGGAKPQPEGSAPPSVTAPVAPPAAVQDADVMVVGNRITIVFSGIPNPPEPHVEQISSGGNITPPFLSEPVKAAGMTAAELQTKLLSLYVPDIYRNITITVLNAERYFFVGGEVRTPGQKPYLSQMTVVKAIQAAGDFTEFANERAVQVLRTDGRSEIIDVKAALRDSSKDSPIYPGDIINVNRSLIK